MGTLTTSTKDTPALLTNKTALAQYREQRDAALTQFAGSSRIQLLWRNLTKATDALLAQVAAGAEVTLVAVGGYGRSELFPFSDVDVLVLVPKASASVDSAVAMVLQQLWDMQIPVSHATRTLEESIEAARQDSSITAALMDARYISGNRAAYQQLKKRLRADVFGQNPREFVAAKLSERDHRHGKWGDSRFMLEPNIKEGKGGLRDLHTLTWLARYCYQVSKASELVREELLSEQEWKHYREAYLFFSCVRAHMHLARGRADERLTFDLQAGIATALNFPGKTAQERAEKFMLRYFQYAREVGTLTRIFCAVLEDENLRMPFAPFAQSQPLGDAFTLEGGRLQFAAQVLLTAQPVLMVELFHIAQQFGLDIHPRAQLSIARALPLVSRQLPFEGRANQLFLKILLSDKAPEITLRRMNEMGVLGALVPEFGRITGMMQYDGYHTYTVDEHTLVAVGNLTTIESGEWQKDMPLATMLAEEVGDRAPLYLAMLCHDLAKGSGGGHAEKGEAIVARIATRLGLSATQSELAGWLVKQHLMLSETAFKRDLDDAKTIADFVSVVQSPERLRLLLLVTVADIKAVGPSIWNRWKGRLMRDLYHRAMVLMGVGFDDVAPQATIQQVLLKEVLPDIRDAAQQFMDGQLPSSWWYRPREEQIACITAYARWQKMPEAPALVITHDAYRAVSEITCCITHAPGLFRDLAGVMAWIGASIVSARSMVLPSGVMIANLGVQTVEETSFANEPKRLEPVAELIAKAVAGTLDFASELPKRRVLSRGREVSVAPSVFIDNQVSATASVVEVNARDRLGLLYDILGAFAQCNVQVMTAHIATYGKKAVDVFYVKDAYGIKIIHWRKLAELQKALQTACGMKEEGHEQTA
ncbi:MAG: [protein-PII] uridylyltransferase [Rickettsiales bacterium]